jgi:peptide-methionine (S)-S-oxide reductase
MSRITAIETAPGPGVRRPAAASSRGRSWSPAALLGLLIAVALLLTPWAPALAATEEAVLAGGCFWCLEHDLEDLPGVLDVESGYSGGKKPNPTYQEVSGGGTGYQESVRVRFDNTKLRYEALLRAYWRNIDPFDGGGQFCDRGDSYRPVIFTTNATQAVEARNSLVAAARELGKPAASLKVSVRALTRFWPAETYHQNYARRNGLRYRYYRWACRRDQRLDAVWGSQARRGERWRNAGQATVPPAAASAPATAAGKGTSTGSGAPAGSATLPPGGSATASPGRAGPAPAAGSSPAPSVAGAAVTSLPAAPAIAAAP